MANDFDMRELHSFLVSRILDGPGEAPTSLRRSAFENTGLEGPLEGLVARVAAEPTKVGGTDFAAARAAGFSEDQLFELVICGAVGQASREYQAALRALEAAAASGGTGRAT